MEGFCSTGLTARETTPSAQTSHARPRAHTHARSHTWPQARHTHLHWFTGLEVGETAFLTPRTPFTLDVIFVGRHPLPKQPSVTLGTSGMDDSDKRPCFHLLLGVTEAKVASPLVSLGSPGKAGPLSQSVQSAVRSSFLDYLFGIDNA